MGKHEDGNLADSSLKFWVLSHMNTHGWRTKSFAKFHSEVYYFLMKVCSREECTPAQCSLLDSSAPKVSMPLPQSPTKSKSALYFLSLTTSHQRHWPVNQPDPGWSQCCRRGGKFHNWQLQGEQVDLASMIALGKAHSYYQLQNQYAFYSKTDPFMAGQIWRRNPVPCPPYC